MRYMLLVYSPEKSWTLEEWTRCTVESGKVCQELAANGALLDASPLHPVATGVSVRVRDGKPLITHGPFVETTEQLGGYFLVDVADLDQAIGIAARLPAAAKGTVEIRPIFELPTLPPNAMADREAHRAAGKTEYLLLCYDDEDYWQRLGAEAHRAAMEVAVGITRELADQGKYLTAAPLHPSATATSVRVRDGKKVVMDGPFSETREILGGFYLIRAHSLQEAIDIAARHPGATVGGVEVRPVFPLGGPPPEEDRVIRSERLLSFSREAVFSAYANPELWARWWGPEGFRNTFHEFQFRPGGDWRFTMHGPNGQDYENLNVFEIIQPPARIVLRHIPNPVFRMDMTLEEKGPTSTLLRWEMVFETAEVRDAVVAVAGQGNEQNFDRLTAVLKEIQTR